MQPKTLKNFQLCEPHRSIIELLHNVEFDEDGTPLNPLATAHCFDDFDEEVEAIDAALIELKEADLIVTRTDPHTGYRQFGLKEYVEKSDAVYEKLKDRVFAAARTRGLTPRWSEGRGWRLEDHTGAIMCCGPMHALDTFLHAVEAERPPS